MKRFFLPSVIYIAFFFGSNITTEAQAVESINARIGFGIPTNSISTNKQFVQLAPTIELIGIGMDVRLNDYFSFTPFLDFTFSEVLYSSRTRIVHPRPFVNITDNNASTLLSFYIGLPFIVYAPIAEFFRIGFGVSPTIAIRIPVNGRDQTTIQNYYLSDGRFFTPEVIINFGYAFQDIELLFSGRVLLPISNVWNGDETPFANGMVVSIMTQIRFTLSQGVEEG